MRLAIALLSLSTLAAGWPMESHDVRRTSQSDVRGPRSPSHITSILLTGGHSVNMPVTAADDGTIFTGTWGLVRSGGSTDRTRWDKFDGKLYSFDRTLDARWITDLDLVPYCYSFGSRMPTPSHCPDGGTVNGYNGTVEGVATLDATRERLYVGRGDGKLYAIDTRSGEIVWRFTSFNPELPSDPEGGGEAVAGPLVDANGIIYFTTVAVGEYETNAVYALNPDGTMRWRYPADEKTLDHLIWAAPALSPDGQTLYIAGAWGPAADDWDRTLPGTIHALRVNDGSAKWTFHPVNEAEWWKPPVWSSHLAVGSDGTIYIAGTQNTFGGGSAVLFAIRDLGNSAQYAWPRMVDLDRGEALVAAGIALREVNGETVRVYATSGDPYSVLAQGYGAGGELVAVDASSGSVLWRFDPESHGGFGSMTGIAIDAEGVIYTGVSGQRDGGRVYAVREDGSLMWQYTLGGLLEWAHPIIGPFGDLYTAETRRCTWMGFPVEDGLCDAFDVNPRIYRITDRVMRRRAVR
jgi:outer membrane protein assembly factor BamB